MSRRRWRCCWPFSILGFKGMRLGPTLPGFLSPGVAKVLVENFDIKLIGTVEEDIAAMMAGR